MDVTGIIQTIAILFPAFVGAVVVVAAVLILARRKQWSRRRSLGTLVLAILLAAYPAWVLTGRWIYEYGYGIYYLVDECGPRRGLELAREIQRGDSGAYRALYMEEFDYSVPDLCTDCAHGALGLSRGHGSEPRIAVGRPPRLRMGRDRLRAYHDGIKKLLPAETPIEATPAHRSVGRIAHCAPPRHHVESSATPTREGKLMSEAFWDKRSATYDAKIREHDARYDQTITDAKAWLKPDDSVLDFAGASGEMSLDLAPHVARCSSTSCCSTLRTL